MRRAASRGVEMSLNMLIMIVLGLIVLGIAVYLLTKGASGGNKDLNSCSNKGGECKDACDRDAGEQSSSLFTAECEKGELCCIPQDKGLG